MTGSDAASCTGGEIVPLTSGGYGPFTVDESVIVVAAPGIYASLVASSGGTGITTIRISNTMVTDNTTGLFNEMATIVSWGNNKVQGNTNNKSGTITVVAQD